MRRQSLSHLSRKIVTTARRLFGITTNERQTERFYFPSRREREAQGLVVESVSEYSR
jgi:hypothetical protein